MMEQSGLKEAWRARLADRLQRMVSQISSGARTPYPGRSRPAIMTGHLFSGLEDGTASAHLARDTCGTRGMLPVIPSRQFPCPLAGPSRVNVLRQTPLVLLLVTM